MIIRVDVDGTICTNRDELRKTDLNASYKDVTPYMDRIKIVNELYDNGEYIIYWTGRGAISKVDYFELTKQQLKEWGAKYHLLEVANKPHFDMYICDKSFNADAWFKEYR